jgi:methyl-accepting chemotaxis protein-1 (serine sensor receptor)
VRTTLTQDESRLAKQLAQDRARFVKEGLQPAVAALRAKDIDTVRQLVFEKIRPLYVPVRTGIDSLMKLQLDTAEEEYRAAVARYETQRWWVIASTVAGLLLAAFFGFTLIRGISRSLHDALDIAHAVAQGDLSHTIDLTGKDEVSQVLIALSGMQNT